MTVVVPDSDVFISTPFLFIILLIVLLQLRERKLRSWKLILFPIIMLIISLTIFYNEISNIYGLILMIMGFLIGMGLGILIANFMEVKIDPEDNSVILKGSYIAVGLWILIILIKIFGENYLNSTGIIRLDVLALVFMMMTLGAMISRRTFIYWKYLKHKKTKNAINS